MTIAIKPKIAKVKEPTLNDLAKANARSPDRGRLTSGQNGNGQALPTVTNYDAWLRKQLGELLDGPAGTLLNIGIDDRLQAVKVFESKGPLSDLQRTFVTMLLARHKPANGNGQPQVASAELPPAMTAATVPAGIAARSNGKGHEITPDEFNGAMAEALVGAGLAMPKHGKAKRSVSRNSNGNGKAHTEAQGHREPAEGYEVEIPCELIDPHPANRRSSDKDPEVVKLAKSIQVEEQIQAITVEPWASVAGEVHYRIICGERRWRACRVAGKATVRCRVRYDLSPDQVLRMMAAENAARKDLNPIERARQAEQLGKPIAEGGSGLTREQQAPYVGVQDAASVSNLVRLLKLPKVWQDRVAAGELQESWARLLLKISHAPKLLDQAGASWELHAKGKHASCKLCSGGDHDCWESRRGVEEMIGAILEDFTRPVMGEKRSYGYHELRPKFGSDYYDYSGAYPILFDATPELEQALDIHDFEIDGKTVRLATDAKLYDKHQLPAIKELVDSKQKSTAEKAGRDKPKPKREPTAAEKKENAKKQAEQLRDRVAAWRHKLLRGACIAAIDAGLDSGLRIVLAFAAQDTRGYDALHFRDALTQVRGVKPRSSDYKTEYWPCVAAIGDDFRADKGDDEGAVVAELAKRILAHDGKDWRFPTLPHSLVESYAAAIDVKLPQAWANCSRELREELFLLHGSGALRDLSKEMGVFIFNAGSKTRAAMAKVLLAKEHLPLPKCLKPLAAAAGKRSRKARR